MTDWRMGNESSFEVGSMFVDKTFDLGRIAFSFFSLNFENQFPLQEPWAMISIYQNYPVKNVWLVKISFDPFSPSHV